jgi:Sec-independent protein translocase protein TatA
VISSAAFFMLVGLLVFGPKKTMEMAQTIGRVLAQVKKTSSQFQAELRQEVALTPKLKENTITLST